MKINLNDSKGITIIALIITIIVMIILATISLKYGFDSINSTQDTVIESELETVQQALLQQYSKANTIEGVGKRIDEGNFIRKTDGYIGIPLTANEIEKYLKDNNVKSDKNGFNLLKFDSNYSDTVTYDTAYYKLEESDLEKLGIEDAKGSAYLVNYSTGEVWDLANVRYQNGEYAYINGIGTELEISKENFTECPIKITLLNEMRPNGSNYVVSLKVTDDLAKISGDNKDDHITVEDFTSGRIVVKIDNIEKTINEIKGKVEIANINNIKEYIIKKDETQSIGEHYEYNILINKDLFPNENSTITLIIKENTLKDEENYTNIETEISTSLDDSGKNAGVISYSIGTPKYFTKSEEYPNGYTDNKNRTWGTSAIVELTLKCTTGLLNQDYVFGYVLGKNNSNLSGKNEEVKYITLRPKEGDKEVKGSIYLDSYTGEGVLTVGPTNSNYKGKYSNSIGTTLKNTTVCLDNDPPEISVYYDDGNGKKELTSDYYTRDDVYFRFNQDDVEKKRISRLVPEISYLYEDNFSGIKVYDGGVWSCVGINPDSNEVLSNELSDLGSYKGWFSTSHYTIKPGSYRTSYGRDARFGGCFKCDIDDSILDKYNKIHNYLLSGEYYVFFDYHWNLIKMGEFLGDNIGNNRKELYKIGPIKVDTLAPKIEKVFFDDSGNGKIEISDDYSGVIDDFSKIKYAWVKTKNEIPTKWNTVTEENIKLIQYNNANSPLRLQVNIESPSQIGEWYLCTTIDGYKDIAGNEANSKIVYSDESIICENDLKIEISETSELGYPKEVSIDIISKSNKKFGISKIWYEHKGLDDEFIILDTEIYCSGKYKSTFGSTVNGPIIIHITDSFGNEYIEEYTIKNVQETILIYEITDENEALILPFYYKSMLMYIDWGDGKKDYITKNSCNAKMINFNTWELEVCEMGDNVPIHKYNTSGKKEIKISGDEFMDYDRGDESFYRITNDQIRINESRDELVEVKQFGIHKEINSQNDKWDMHSFYHNCKNLVKLPEIMNEDNKNSFKDVYRMYATFSGTGIKNIPNNFFENAINVIDFAKTFENTPITKIPPELFKTTTNAEKFSETFSNTQITEIPPELFKTTTKVTDFSSTFAYTQIAEVPPELFKTTINVETFSETFSNTLITEIPPELFKTTINTKSFFGTFSNTQITEIPPELFKPTIKAESFAGTFSNTRITEIPPELFKPTIKAESFSGTFSNTAITEIPPELFKPTINATYFNSTFSNTQITEIPPELFKTTTKAEDFSNTFAYTQITEIPPELFKTTTKAEDFSNTFAYTQITEIPPELFKTTTKAESFSGTFSNTRITEIPEELFKTTKEVLAFYGSFENTSIKTIPQKLFETTTKAFDFRETFECTQISKIPDGLFNNCFKEEVKNYSYKKSFEACFRGCEKLQSVNNLMWDTMDKTQIDGIEEMFRGCTSLETVGNVFEGFSNIKNLDGIFIGCTNLKNIDKNIFNGCNNVTSLGGTFGNCSNLKQLDLNIFNNIKNQVTNWSYKDIRSRRYYGIFQGCTKLEKCPEIWTWESFKNSSNEENKYNIFFGTSSVIVNKIPKSELKTSWIVDNPY